MFPLKQWRLRWHRAAARNPRIAAARNPRIAAVHSCVTRDDPAFAEGCRVFAEQSATAEQAGFEWARANDLGDRCQCSGAGARFEAGCQAYVDGLAD